MGGQTTSARLAATEDHPVNQVLLTGRLSGEPQARELPSGDTVVLLRVVVPRVETARRRAEAPASRVDTIDVACWARAVQRRALRLGDGDPVRVAGALRRRFWRTPGGAASRYEVEATSVHRAPAAAPS
jgi:single-strand DNA-binding protein